MRRESVQEERQKHANLNGARSSYSRSQPSASQSESTEPKESIDLADDCDEKPNEPSGFSSADCDALTLTNTENSNLTPNEKFMLNVIEASEELYFPVISNPTQSVSKHSNLLAIKLFYMSPFLCVIKGFLT